MYDYTEDEAYRSWYSDKEVLKMKERRSKTVERMESGKDPKRDSTYRGLESLSAKGEAELASFIRCCVDAVLDEQERQVFLEVNDAEMIALVSSQNSEECAQKALNRARADAREAKRCYRRMKDLPAEEQSSDHSSYRNLVPILKTGNIPSDIRESPSNMQTLEAIC